ncbi:MAG: Gfo/Idh/MocA family oxidoreductase [Phycisphaerae bacterium]|nr:Gfo/Idh/MocA family oxidoreductase [Phycisphaerae bacterium]
MSKELTRRAFLGTSGRTAAGIAAGLSASQFASSARAAGANEKILVGLIGCGGMGNANKNDFMRADDVELIAVCDVDQGRMEKSAADIEKKYGRKAQMFKDYRKLLDMKELDAVIVGTPDHWHAICMIAACAAGKDVYVEKPCSHNVKEGRAMVSAARKFNRVTQVGTQQRSGKHFQEAVEFIQSGKLGKVTMTRTWTYGNEAPDGMGKAEDGAAPPGVDYDMWLGPAPKRLFNKNRFHHSFRWYFDYAAGMVGDWNVHLQDIVHWAMKSPHPTSVSSAGDIYCLTDDRDTPDTMQTLYEFPDFVHCYTMRKASGPPWWLEGGYGIEFSGTNGTLFVNRNSWKVIPDPADQQDKNSAPRCEKIERVQGSYGDDAYWDQHWPHVQNFLACVKSRQRPICDIEVNHETATACHLSNVSLRIKRKIYWDHKQELCFRDRELKTPDEEANALLTREYRKGYELPNV